MGMSRLITVFKDDVAELRSPTICEGHVHDILFLDLADLTNPLSGVQTTKLVSFGALFKRRMSLLRSKHAVHVHWIWSVTQMTYENDPHICC